MELRKIIGGNVKHYRFKRNMTQEALSELTNISTNSISSIENGKVDVRLSTLESIAKALETDVVEFFGKQKRAASKWRVDLRDKKS